MYYLRTNIWKTLTVMDALWGRHLSTLESGKALMGRVSAGPVPLGETLENKARDLLLLRDTWEGKGVACTEQMERGQSGRWPPVTAGAPGGTHPPVGL